LQLLQDAASQLAKSTGNSRLPILNGLAVKLGVATGDSAPTVFQAIANKVNQEVERASAGGATPFKDELQGGKDILSSSNPEKVTNDIVHSYIGLMAGRMAAADENLYSTAQKHLWNIEPQTTAIFQKHGYDTPWVQNKQGNQGNQNQANQNTGGGQPRLTAKPSAATGTFTAKNGKLYWTDGKNNLGLAQQ
jgi:hypothetical protein